MIIEDFDVLLRIDETTGELYEWKLLKKKENLW